MKVMVVFGTRPEAVKMCPLVLELKKNRNIKTIVCVTGQHKEMLKQVLDVFNIVPDYNLAIMRKGQTLSTITSLVIRGIDKILSDENPTIMLVHGDTTTSFAASLAAFYKQIPIGHVEAGLRTYDLCAPYPEEFNRQAVDIISRYYFAPTAMSRKNLIKEGKPGKNIFVTGNTVIDALNTTVSEDYKNEHLEWGKDSRLILFTAHRRESIGFPMREMFRAVRALVDDNEDIKLIYPIHKNHEVRAIADKFLANHERIRLIEPLDVFDFHNFIKHSYLVLTDSGGIQEEAPALGKPVLVMRNTTERQEGIEAGTLKLVGTTYQDIYEGVKKN